MLVGKRLFANFVPEDSVMAHLCEYTPEELVFLFHRAGFLEVEWKFLTFPDAYTPRLLQIGYKIICQAFPSLSNLIFLWSIKEK